ncbi:ABC transporter permease [Micromonospora sp. NPDC003197]
MRIIRYAALFVMPFVMVSMMFATYVGTMHSPHPREMPVAVVGAGPAAQAIVDAFNAAPGNAMDARLVESKNDAVELLKDREIAGALAIPTEGSAQATIYTAMAAGASQATTVQQLLAPIAIEQNWTAAVENVAPLPDGDTAGIAVLFAAMGMMLAGYVPLSLLLMACPHLLSLRRFLPIVVGWSAATSSIIWLILGPIVGAVDGHYLEFLGVGMLATGAVALTQLLLTKLMGPLAVLVGMLLWVVFGMPSSNLALSVDMMPGFFNFLHGVLPLPAAGEALRSLLYFDGRGAGGHLLVLAVWAVAALVLSWVKERVSGHAIPTAPQVSDPNTPLPALAGSPPRSKRFRYVTVAAFPLTILVMVVGLMGFSMHKPEIHNLPVAVVGATTEQAQQVAAGLESKLGDMLDVEVLASTDEGIDRILDQDIVATYVLPTARGAEATLYTSSGAGVSQQSAAKSIFQAMAAQQQMPLAMNDVAPLSDTDTMGSNSLYVGMSWIMAGFLMLAVLRGGAPELKRLRQFLPLLAGWSVGMAVWLWLLFDVIIGAVTGHAWEMIGFGAATIFAVSLVTGVFTRTIGLAAIIPVMVVMMLAGVPASGGGLSIYMVPELFQGLKDILPLPAAVDTARSLVYFNSAGIGRNLLVIGVWAAVGLVLNLLVDLWQKRRDDRARITGPDERPPAPDFDDEIISVDDIGELEPAAAR